MFARDPLVWWRDGGESDKRYSSVNLKLGYPILEIRSPIEVLDYDD